MSGHAYSEDSLVEQPAIQLFAEIGWHTLSALEEVFGVGGTLERETKGEAVLVPRLRTTLERLNPSLPRDAISGAIDQLIRDRSVMSLVWASSVYELLKEGIPATLPECKAGGRTTAHTATALQRRTPDLLPPELRSGAIELPDIGTFGTQEII